MLNVISPKDDRLSPSLPLCLINIIPRKLTLFGVTIIKRNLLQHRAKRKSQINVFSINNNMHFPYYDILKIYTVLPPNGQCIYSNLFIQ